MSKERKNFTIRINTELHNRIRIQSIKENRSVSDIVNELIEQYLKSKGVL